MADSDTTGSTAAMRRDLVEDELFDKASQLFAEKGFAGTTLQDIASAVGMSRPSLYRYVRSKEELLERVVRDVTETAGNLVDEVLCENAETPDVQLRRLIVSMVELVGRNPAEYRLLAQNESSLPSELAARHRSTRHKVLEAVTGVISEGQRQARFSPVDPRTAALSIIAMWNSVALWHHSDNLTTIARDIGEMGVRSISVPEHSAGSTPHELIALARETLDRLEVTIPAADHPHG
ncbi:TetR/AcrR family transcriptional regulator [Gordonia oryzae]|uniref:TetR/AcrR family transcriptional regulator n=1 Tax=Gordonia oryzae TaxID=2487349 RepID=A0A3N4G9V4_9ACTN|nr:TetR/AcrR family transcriptional regulator [Gordonia oryzae]RPA59035.1 TetR/AcrR family transcriptional regulator [Gordonia oryzae]